MNKECKARVCDIEAVIPFDGIIVMMEDGIRYWMGYEEAFDRLIEQCDDPRLDTFDVYKLGKRLGTVGEYRKARGEKHE